MTSERASGNCKVDDCHKREFAREIELLRHAASWHPMNTAPKDRQILVRRHNDVGYEYDLVWWDGGDDDDGYPWCNGHNAYPEGRLDDWHEIPD